MKHEKCQVCGERNPRDMYLYIVMCVDCARFCSIAQTSKEFIEAFLKEKEKDQGK